MSGSSVVDVDEFTRYQIPNEVLSGIFSHLSVADLLRAGAVCEGWQALSEDAGLWKEKCLKLDIDMHSLPSPPQHAQPGPIYQRSPWKSVFIRHSLVKRNWGSDDPQYCKQLVGHTDSVTAIVVHGDHVITAADDTSVKVWCTLTGQCVHDWGLTVANVDRFRVKEMLVSENAVAVHYQYVQQGPTHCHCIKVFSINNGLCLKTIETPYGAEMVLHKSVFAVVFDDALCIWSVQDEALKLEHKCVQERAGPMGIGCDGTHVVTRDTYGIAKLWHIQTGLCAKVIETDAPSTDNPFIQVVHSGDISILVCVEDGHGHGQGYVSAYDLNADSRLYSIPVPLSGIEAKGSIRVTKDRLLISCTATVLREYDMVTGRILRVCGLGLPSVRLLRMEVLSIGLVVIGVEETCQQGQEPEGGLLVHDRSTGHLVKHIRVDDYAQNEASVFHATDTVLAHICNDDDDMCIMYNFNVHFP